MEMFFQSVEVFVPQAPIPSEPLLEFDEWLRSDAVHAALRVGTGRDEAGLLEHAQVL